MPRTLEQFIAGSSAPKELESVIMAVVGACAEISALVSRGALAGVLGSAETENVQGEEQKKLDLKSNDVMLKAARACAALAGAASEEEENPATLKAGAPYLLLFDPLDGSSNIDVNVSIGTIFSVLPTKAGKDVEPFLQSGRNQVAAGYAVYGPQTTLVLTLGDGVSVFTLDPRSEDWLQTAGPLRIPEMTREFSINMSNMRHWDKAMRGYVEECLAGKEGPRAKDFNMRWIASMVADVHRILTRGGVFLYPWDRREPGKPGKLRLMYEANPMGLLVEQAGGRAFDGKENILDIQPTALHQRVSVMMGSKEEIDVLEAKHAS